MTKTERERSHIQKQITVSVVIARKIAARYGREGSCKKLRGPATRRTDVVGISPTIRPSRGWLGKTDRSVDWGFKNQ
ncbi:hypothetical protein [Pseudomonas putida]|uniref:hypothetical protein n=1 Tax=Pseudomonas TaxID=286 RepID=UPI001074B3D9|nr:hypothetical protein [Pseudomonas putida]MCG3643515.1 hypothetical protein [Pseudomonas putida]TFW26176.1 hypothetical protein E4L40_03565 [Pseudomonas putida]